MVSIWFVAQSAAALVANATGGYRAIATANKSKTYFLLCGTWTGPETEYQKQTLRHCWGDEAPHIVGTGSTNREMPIMVHAAYSQLDISQFDEADRYKFMMGTVIPRPIALVTSLSRDGVLNATPFSQFVVISVTPPLLGFVAHEGEHGLKDKVRNVIESGEYVINTVAEPMAKQVQICSENFPPLVSEVAGVGFHTLPSNFVRPGRIAQSSVHFECRLNRVFEFGHEGSHTHLIVREIIAVHCPDGMVSGHRVSHKAMNSLGRIAGRSYCRTGDKFDA
jgi:flavin reductase (DIM6/NTAB) family NADH-FMN oxidoreductase RutF